METEIRFYWKYREVSGAFFFNRPVLVKQYSLYMRTLSTTKKNVNDMPASLKLYAESNNETDKPPLLVKYWAGLTEQQTKTSLFDGFHTTIHELYQGTLF